MVIIDCEAEMNLKLTKEIELIHRQLFEPLMKTGFPIHWNF